ncbi:cyclic pyranopterin monophosphate synthase MoaC [bacterium 1XD42-1]|nr:cyclic pyranopterin monophosphate synthase MoaC [bacterium 1XD42-8]RKJ66724.1 cyclic pyranopterin monophosphate synthase MoaC [bacterium 1XD42-1]
MITHIDENGNAVMVDVSGKAETFRTAVAQGEIHVGPEAFAAIRDGAVKKGDVLGVAQVAGIMAAKRTWELIPLCHPLFLSKCAVTFTLREEDHTIIAECTASTTGQTGVEMEALTGVSGALLTIYDMCKAIDKSMVLGQIHLVQKTGGKSGDFTFPLQKIE